MYKIDSNKQVFFSLEFVNMLLQLVAKPVKMRLYFFNSAVTAKIKTGLLWTNMLCAKKQCIATVEKGYILSCPFIVKN